MSFLFTYVYVPMAVIEVLQVLSTRSLFKKSLIQMRSIMIVACLLLAGMRVHAQCHILDYGSYKRVLKIEGEYVLNYSSYKRMYKFDGEYLLDYASNKRLLKFDGEYVIRYSDYRRIGKLDGEYLIDYSNYKRVAKLECPGRRSALAAAVYYLY